MSLNLDSVVTVVGDQLASDLPDETIILHLPRGTYFGVEGVARDVWQMIQRPISLRAVRDSLAQRYQVPAEQVEDDLFSFLRELIAHELVTVESA